MNYSTLFQVVKSLTLGLLVMSFVACATTPIEKARLQADKEWAKVFADVEKYQQLRQLMLQGPSPIQSLAPSQEVHTSEAPTPSQKVYTSETEPAPVIELGKPSKEPVTGEEFVFVKGGCFQMGDTFGDGGADEKPLHEVCVGDFYMGTHEVTVGEFGKFVEATGYRTEAEKGDGCFTLVGNKWEKKGDTNWKNPGFPINERHPVGCVSWNDSVAYAEWLSKETGKGYRLPKEVEWEYAARGGGKREKWAGASSEKELGEYAWYSGNSGISTHLVGKKRPNELGLYDMTGNVSEWCADWYGENYYKGSPRDNPGGPNRGSARVLRGGSSGNDPGRARGTSRGRGVPSERTPLIGFRLVFPSG